MSMFWRITAGLSLLIGLALTALHIRASNDRKAEELALLPLKKNINLSSRSFPPFGDMPVSCSCKGSEASPALTWETAPSDVQSYVILATDYDVPMPGFPVAALTHWAVYNLPSSVQGLPEGVTTEQMRMLGGKTGKNSLGNVVYMGPCPPVGRHAYVFRVYAVDRMLDFSEFPDRDDLLDAMQGHILGYGELTGYFQ